MTRKHGRGPRGERVVDHVPAGKYHSTTMLGALRYDGTIAAMVYEGGTNVAVMEAFAEGELRRILRPRDIVVMDNLSAHKGPNVIAAVESAGAIVCYLPPYSPDYNPIEEMWSKVKEILCIAQGSWESWRERLPRVKMVRSGLLGRQGRRPRGVDIDGEA